MNADVRHCQRPTAPVSPRQKVKLFHRVTKLTNVEFFQKCVVKAEWSTLQCWAKQILRKSNEALILARANLVHTAWNIIYWCGRISPVHSS